MANYKKVNKEARKVAVEYLLSFAKEGSNHESDFIQDRDRLEVIRVNDYELVLAMRWIAKLLQNELNKLNH